MFFIFFALLITLRSSISVAQPQIRKQFPWYHTTDEIHARVAAFADNCSNAQVTLDTRSVSSGSDQAPFDVVYVKKGSSEGKKNAFFVFGEHARELVTTESALELLKNLCESNDGSKNELAERVLSSTNLIMLPNANPLGRKRVEVGEYCKRTNENQVDLNRNWENGQASEEETNPGPSAFSEPETQIIRDLVEEQRPDLFLSVHSGAYLLSTPFGSESSVPDNEQQMLDVLKPISQDFCNSECPFGALSDVIGYKSQGCDIDYLKEHLNTPYVFTWEIYVDSNIRQFYAEKAKARAEGRPMKTDAAAFFNMNSLMLLQGSQHLRGLRAFNATHVVTDDDMDCFRQFNPQTQQETQAVAENWAAAFMTVCDSLVPAHWPTKETSATPVLNAATVSATPMLDAAPTNVSSTDSSPQLGMLPRFVSPHSGSDSLELNRILPIHDPFTEQFDSPLTKFLRH